MVISSRQSKHFLFVKARHFKLKIGLAFLVALGLMFFDQRYDSLTVIRNRLSDVLAPIQYAVDWPVRVVGWVKTNIASRKALISENMQLRYQHMVLQAQLQKLLILKKENAQLRQLLKTPTRDLSKVMAAQILAVDTNGYRSIVVINKGSKDKVYIGQPVLDAHGLMGQVIESGELTSTVLLISDLKSAIPVQSNRTGERSILTGKGPLNQLELTHLPTNTDVKEGDLLVTSGLAGRFPEGYPVARVTAVSNDSSDSFLMIKAHSVATLNRSRLVLLVWPDIHE